MSNYNANNNKIGNLSSGVATTDAVNKGQLDSEASTRQTADNSLQTAINTKISNSEKAVANGVATTNGSNKVAQRMDYANLDGSPTSLPPSAHGHSPGEVGLGNVTNNKQVRTTSGNDMQLNWTGSKLQAVVDTTPFDIMTSADISGKLNNGTGTAGLVLRRLDITTPVNTVSTSLLYNYVAFAGFMVDAGVTGCLIIFRQSTGFEFRDTDGGWNSITGALFYWSTP